MAERRDDDNTTRGAGARRPVDGGGQLSIAASLPEAGPDLRKMAAAPRRYLVFTSAGDRNGVAAWLGPARDFDLWVTWYGRGAEPLESEADYYLRRAGSKLQNLHYCFRRWPELFERYEAIMVMDDDVRLSAAKIDALFLLRDRHDLWALQPAFSPFGKVSYGMTQVRRDCELRFVDFIEMTCPLFRIDKLRDFLLVYDPELVGWGCDWWFLHTMGPDLKDRVAIIDSVVCLNPHDSWKSGGMREIDRLQSTEKRRATWERIRDSRGITTEARGLHELRLVPRRGWSRWAMMAFGAAEALVVRITNWGYRTLAPLARLRRSYRSGT